MKFFYFFSLLRRFPVFLHTFATAIIAFTMVKSRLLYHALALVTVFVWSVTFVSSKILLGNDLSPAEIFAMRFTMAYIIILPFARGRIWCDNIKDELLMVALGAFGGSLYFLAENTALRYTGVSNVCLLVCSAPLMTALLSFWLGRNEKLSRRLLVGSLIAFMGAALVIVGDRMQMQLRIVGDLLAIGGAVAWAIYQLLIKRMFGRYTTLFITRKVFAYGLLTILIYFLFDHPNIPLATLVRPVVVGNLLFLGIVASCLCFWLWNVVIGHLGAVVSSNYLYLQPMFAALASAVVLGEPVTGTVVAGAVLIIAGVYWAEH